MRTGRREAPFDMYWLRRAYVSGFPHRIVRRNIAINMRCLRLQRADVKRQHKFFNLATLNPPEKAAGKAVRGPGEAPSPRRKIRPRAPRFHRSLKHESRSALLTPHRAFSQFPPPLLRDRLRRSFFEVRQPHHLAR